MSKLELKVPPPLVGFLTGLLMWLLGKVLPPVMFHLPLQGLLSVLVVLVGVCLMGVSVALFFNAKTTIEPTRPGRAATLVTTGFNRISRNPMYLGVLMFLLAWALWLGNLVAFIWLPLFVLYMNRFQIIPEERFLAKKFGQQYEDYRTRVRRWV